MSDRLDGLTRALELVAIEDPREAAAERWNDGRARYGDVWHGRHPLLEGYLEGLDLRNYVLESIRIRAIPEVDADLVLVLVDELTATLRTFLQALPPEHIDRILAQAEAAG